MVKAPPEGSRRSEEEGFFGLEGASPRPREAVLVAYLSVSHESSPGLNACDLPSLVTFE